MPSNRFIIFANIMGIITSTMYLFLSFVSSDPSIYEIPFGIYIVIQLMFAMANINTFTLVKINRYRKEHKLLLIEKIAQYYGGFVVLLALFGLIEFWWYLIISALVLFAAIIVKITTLMFDKENII